MAALARIDRYRRMTGEKRLAIALGRHELSCAVAQEAIRRLTGADVAHKVREPRTVTFSRALRDVARATPEWYSTAMKREHTVRSRLAERRADDFVPGSPAERIALVWPLTREIVSLSTRYDAEQRLQRHVAVLVRREG